MDFKKLKNFDWRSLKSITNPNAVKDLDKFLDKLPLTVGYNALIAAGLVWVLAGGAVLFATTEASKAAELRAELLEVESLRPPVPEIQFTPVPKSSLETFVEEIEDAELYPVLTLRASNEGMITITGNDSEFTAMTYAIGHIQGGGKNWHVAVDSMCLGPECTGGTLKADLKVSMIKVMDAPTAAPAGGPGNPSL